MSAVTVLRPGAEGTMSLNGRSATIRPQEGTTPRAYIASDPAGEIASCESVQRLADWLFAHGTLSVRFDYDMSEDS